MTGPRRPLSAQASRARPGSGHARDRADPNANLVCLSDWLSNRTLRNFLLRFSEPLWVDVTRNLCLLAVLGLQHLGPSGDAAWCSNEDLSELVQYIQSEQQWPKELMPNIPRKEDWQPPWRKQGAIFAKPSPEWRAERHGGVGGRCTLSTACLNPPPGSHSLSSAGVAAVAAAGLCSHPGRWAGQPLHEETRLGTQDGAGHLPSAAAEAAAAAAAAAKVAGHTVDAPAAPWCQAVQRAAADTGENLQAPVSGPAADIVPAKSSPQRGMRRGRVAGASMAPVSAAIAATTGCRGGPLPKHPGRRRASHSFGGAGGRSMAPRAATSGAGRRQSGRVGEQPAEMAPSRRRFAQTPSLQPAPPPGPPGADEWREAEGRLRARSCGKAQRRRSSAAAATRQCPELRSPRIARGGWAAEVPLWQPSGQQVAMSSGRCSGHRHGWHGFAPSGSSAAGAETSLRTFSEDGPNLDGFGYSRSEDGLGLFSDGTSASHYDDPIVACGGHRHSSCRGRHGHEERRWHDRHRWWNEEVSSESWRGREDENAEEVGRQASWVARTRAEEATLSSSSGSCSSSSSSCQRSDWVSAHDSATPSGAGSSSLSEPGSSTVSSRLDLAAPWACGGGPLAGNFLDGSGGCGHMMFGPGSRLYGAGGTAGNTSAGGGGVG